MKTKPIRLLQDFLYNATESQPNKTAIRYNNINYSYQELYNASQSLASYLNEIGLKKGDRVAIYMDSSWNCAVSIFGILFAEGVFLIINPQTKSDKLKYILDDSDALIIITDAYLEKEFVPILNDLPKLSCIVCSGKFSDTLKLYGKSTRSLEKTLHTTSKKQWIAHSIPLDLAALIYTSGSTGFPKGVMMNHMAMVFAAESIIEYLQLTEHDKIFCVIPFSFDYGLYQLLMTMRLGATIIIERSFVYPAQVVTRIRDSGATVFPGVPTIYMTLIAMHEKSSLVFPSITKITNTAAALSPHLIPKLKQIFPNALIYKMYGITECKRVSYLEPEKLDEKISSVGKAIPGTEAFILSKEGTRVLPGETGILYVRGQHIMLGYWKDPEQTNTMLKSNIIPGETVLCTQDWFAQDQDGYFYFKGRTDDIIKTRGLKVSPVEVENALYGLKGIIEAAVIGVEDTILGNVLKAFIVVDKSSELTEVQVRKYCFSKIEDFMVPKQIVFVPELPKTTSGKIKKKGLNQQMIQFERPQSV